MAPGTTFLPIISDPTVTDSSSDVDAVVFVSGKLYYELVKERADCGMLGKVAVVRVEELSPFPTKSVKEEIAKFANVKGRMVDRIRIDK